MDLGWKDVSFDETTNVLLLAQVEMTRDHEIGAVFVYSACMA